MVFQFTTIGPDDRETSCELFELFLTTLHQTLQQEGSKPPTISLEIGVIEGKVTQAIRTEDLSTVRMAKAWLRNNFDGVKLTNLPESAFIPQNASKSHFGDVVLHNDLCAIKRWRELLTEADPLNGILSSLATNEYSRFFGHISITLQPLTESKIRRHRNTFHKLQHPFFKSHGMLATMYEWGSRSSSLLKRTCGVLLGLLARGPVNDDPATNTASSRHHERETDTQAASNKLSSPCFLSSLRITLYGNTDEPDLARHLVRQLFSPLAQFNAPRLGQFRLRNGGGGLPPTFLLSSSEVASIFHPPVRTTERQVTNQLLQFEPPLKLPLTKDHNNLFLLGKTAYHDQQNVFGLRDQDALLHGFVVGSSGSGKSTLLKTAIVSLMQRGHGLTLVDFHGDFAREVRALVPKRFENRLVQFDATADNPIAFNPLDCPEKDRWPVVSDSVLSAMKQLFGSSWGPRLEQILMNALSACIAAGDATLMDVRRMLEDEPLRVKILSRVKDSLVREFWFVTFAGWSKSYRQEAIQSVINKLDALLTPKLRAMLCQIGKPSFDFRQAFDQGEFVIVNLARGELGQAAASTLGSLILGSIQNAALSRANIPEQNRVPHFVFLDEVQLYSNEQALMSLLSEARKYRVGIWSATQTLSAFENERVLKIITGNAANFISFRVAIDDATHVAPLLNDRVGPKTLVSLPRFHAFARLLIDGEIQQPISQTTIKWV